jgi:iron complex outermembrane receptor protein
MHLRPQAVAGRLAVFAALLFVAPADASPDRPADAFSVLREEQTVTGATKRSQPLSETPSAVTVVTAAEIRAMGYHTVADALRWVRGLFVTSDRNYSYVGIRGLQRPGDYNNKVLLAIDGHTLNGNVFGDALLGDELGLDLERVERIEVVRGPGSTLFGSYAVLAVVNVVTRRASAMPAVAAAGRAGGPGEWRTWGFVSSCRPGLPELTLSGSASGADGQDFYYPEFDTPLTRGGRASGVDGARSWALLGTARWSDWTLFAKLNRREKHVPTGSYVTVFADPRNLTHDGHDLVELSHTRSWSPALEISGRVYWDGSRYDGNYVYGSGSATVVNRDQASGDVVGTEWRANWSAGPRNVLTAGIEAQRHVRAWVSNLDEDPYLPYFDRNIPGGQGALFVQDEIRPGGGLRLTAGARLDGYQDFVPVVSPRVDLVWRLSPATVCKVLAGNAFRAPSVYERFYDDGYSQVANPDLKPERASTVETSIEHQLGSATATLSWYASRVEDLIDLLASATPGLLQFENRQQTDSRGAEAEIDWLAGASTRVRIAAAWQRSTDHASRAELTNSPRWNAHGVVTHAPAGGRLTLGAGVRYLSPRLTLAGNETAAAVVADGRAALQVGPWAGLSLEVRNLFDDRHGDPGSREHLQDQIRQDGRMLYAGIELHRDARP